MQKQGESRFERLLVLRNVILNGDESASPLQVSLNRWQLTLKPIEQLFELLSREIASNFFEGVKVNSSSYWPIADLNTALKYN